MDVILYEGFAKKVMFLYMENKALHDGSTRLTSERVERDKEISEQHLNKNITRKKQEA